MIMNFNTFEDLPETESISVFGGEELTHHNMEKFLSVLNQDLEISYQI